MSTATLTPAFDDFDDLEFEAIVADFHTPPVGEPLPDPEPERTAGRTHRASRAVEEREAIRRSLGETRHRSHEREI